MSKSKLISSLSVIAGSLVLVVVPAAQAFQLQTTTVGSFASEIQVATQPGSPVVLWLAPTKSQIPWDHDEMKLLVRNVSGKCIQGLVVRFVYLRPDGRAGINRTSSFYRPAAGCLEPSATMVLSPRFGFPVSRPSHRPLARFTTTVDLVVYKDGSKWGPAKLTEFDHHIINWVEASKLVSSGAYKCHPLSRLPRDVTPAVAEAVGEICANRRWAATRRAAGVMQK